MEAINDDLILGLTEASQSFGSHAKWAKRLLDSYEKSPQPFVQCLMPHLKRIVIVFKRHAPIERLIRFVSRLAVSTTRDPNLNGRMALVIIQGLLRYHNSKNKAVRFRVCQTIGNILNVMNDEFEMPEELFGRIQDSLLERIKDKVVIIRAMSCAGLSRLQNPTSPDDPVCKALLFALDHDPSSAVRKAALVNIGVSKVTLPHILLRTKDVASEVRISAFNVCTEKMAMKALSIRQRTLVLYAGLMDRDPAVKKACQDSLLPVWLKQCDGSIIKLLSSLDVQEYEKECETVTSFCISPEMQPPVDLNFQFNTELSPEYVFFWRVYCESLRKEKKYEMIEHIFPVAVEFAQILSEHQEDVFVSSQLIRIARMIEMDEVGRTALTNLFLSWLKSDQTDVSLLKSIMNTLHRIVVRKQSGVEGESEFVTNILLVLADLRDPLEDISSEDNEETEAEIVRLEDRFAELSKDFENAKDQYSALKRKKRHNEAREKKRLMALIEQEMEQIDSELASKEAVVHMKWLQLIIVTSDMLERVRISPFSSLADLLHSTILPALKHPSATIREEAIRALCLFLLLDLETARSDFIMFIQAIRNDEIPVQVAAIKACFDILLVHNLCNDPSVSELFDCLSKSLDSEQQLIRAAAGQGFAKLFANSRISDANLLSKLILCLFDPLTAEDFELRQTLSVFFPTYCQLDRLHRKLIVQAWCDVVRTLCDAPKLSPIRKISSQQITPFLLYLVNGDDVNISDLILLILAVWCGKLEDTALVKFCTHSLSLLPVHGLEQNEACMALYLAKNLERDLTDKTALRVVLKTISTIEATGVILSPDFDETLIDALYGNLCITRHHPKIEESGSDDEIESPNIEASESDDEIESISSARKRTRNNAPSTASRTSKRLRSSERLKPNKRSLL